MTVDKHSDMPLGFSSAKAFDTWLAKNWQKQDGIWIKMAKKGSGIPSVTSDEAVDVGFAQARSS